MQERTVSFQAQTPNRFPLNGIGVEWDEYLLTKNCRGSYLPEIGIADETDFALVCRRAKLLGIRYVRMFLFNNRIEPERGRFDFSNEYTKARLRELDFCEENGISVCVVISDVIGFDEAGKPTEKISVQDYVAHTMRILDYLLNECGYTCVREVTPFNEPNYAVRAGAYTLEQYTEICRQLDKQTRETGLRDRIKLNLCDTSSMDGQKLFFRAVGGLGDLYNNHNYICMPDDTDDMLSALTKIGVSFTDRLGAPYMLGEFGWLYETDTFSAGGIDTYIRGLFLPRLVIQSLNAGAVGASYWCFHDTFYAPDVSARMVCGLFCYKDESWRCRPQYYSYGLMMNYADPGAEVIPLKSDTEGVVAVLLHNPDGSRTYFAVNYTDAPAAVALPCQDASSYRRFVFREDSLPKDEAMIASNGTVQAECGLLTDELAPMSFYVYTTKQEVRA